MRVYCNFDGLKEILGEVETGIGKAATAAMRETTIEARDQLREQVVSNGLGNRLANTWTARSYPDGEKDSINPAGFIWSRAPDIIDSFIRGATIRPVNGAKFLWIPTKNVPLARGRVNRRGQNIKGGAMPPEDVENQFNTDFEIRRGRNGTLLAFIDVVRSLNGKTFRKSTKGRTRQGRFSKPVLMFVLVPTTRMPKLLDLEGVAAKWSTSFENAFLRLLGSQ